MSSLLALYFQDPAYLSWPTMAASLLTVPGIQIEAGRIASWEKREGPYFPQVHITPIYPNFSMLDSFWIQPSNDRWFPSQTDWIELRVTAERFVAR